MIIKRKIKIKIEWDKGACSVHVFKNNKLTNFTGTNDETICIRYFNQTKLDYLRFLAIS